jgi:hypothetical protein
MVGHIVAALRQNPIVRDIEILEVIDEASVQLLQVRAEIIDSTSSVREAFFSRSSKYSYHWQTRTGELLLRWDNAPYHPEISTHPHHKHAGKQLAPSERVPIDDGCAELTAILRSKGQM